MNSRCNLCLYSDVDNNHFKCSLCPTNFCIECYGYDDRIQNKLIEYNDVIFCYNCITYKDYFNNKPLVYSKKKLIEKRGLRLYSLLRNEIVIPTTLL